MRRTNNIKKPTMSFKVRFADQTFSGNDATLVYVAALHRWGV